MDTQRDERGFWAWIAECAAEEDEDRDPVELAADLGSTWPLLSEQCREGYRQLADDNR